MKYVLTEMTYDELPTFVMVEKLFGEYRNVKRRDVIVATLSMFTTARLSSQQLTVQLTVNQQTSRSYSHPMCYFSTLFSWHRWHPIWPCFKWHLTDIIAGSNHTQVIALKQSFTHAGRQDIQFPSQLHHSPRLHSGPKLLRIIHRGRHQSAGSIRHAVTLIGWRQADLRQLPTSWHWQSDTLSVTSSAAEHRQDSSNMVQVTVEPGDTEQAGLLCPSWLKQDPTGFYHPWPRPVHGQWALNEAAHRHSAAATCYYHLRCLRQIRRPRSDDSSCPRDYHVQDRLLQHSTGWSASVEQFLIMLDHDSVYKLLPDFQSTYRAQHSTETAVLKVLSDILTAADRGDLSM